ncbi:MAG: TadE family protein [Gemmobacter sp.]
MTSRNLLRRLWRRGVRDEGGAVTIDFLIVFPLFMMILLASIESGVLMTRFVMMERSLDLAVRNLRLGLYEDPTHELLKNEVCDNIAVMPNCRRDLLLELRPVDRDTWNVFDEPPSCSDRPEEVDPLLHPPFEVGGENELMLIRVCGVFDPYFPTTPWGLRLKLDPATGGYQLVSMSAFVNEPR